MYDPFIRYNQYSSGHFCGYTSLFSYYYHYLRFHFSGFSTSQLLSFVNSIENCINKSIDMSVCGSILDFIKFELLSKYYQYYIIIEKEDTHAWRHNSNRNERHYHFPHMLLRFLVGIVRGCVYFFL